MGGEAPLVPVPHQVQRRAWEAAWTLREEFAGRLTPPQSVRMAEIAAMAPCRLGWRDCGDALATWNIVVEVRT